MKSRRSVEILHVTHSSNVSAIPTAAGPAHLLDMGLDEAIRSMGVDIEVVEIAAPESAQGEVAAAFAVYSMIAEAVRSSRRADRLSVVLSGSCGGAIGAASGMTGTTRGAVWLDRHGDFNTPETTRSGLLDGMTLSSLTGRCWRTMCSGVRGFERLRDEDVVLIGAQDLDEGEAGLLAESGLVHVPTAHPLDRCFEEIEALAARVSSVYVHVDLDVLDPSEGRANAFVTSGGLPAQELYAVLEFTVGTCPVEVVTFASYDPEVDEDDHVAQIANQAAGVVVGSWSGQGAQGA